MPLLLDEAGLPSPTRRSGRVDPRPGLYHWAAWVGLGLALLLLTVRFDGGRVARDRILHPEALYPAALYLEAGEWFSWSTPFAPYFVPDLPLFFLCRGVTGDPVAALYLFAAVQFLLLVGACRWLIGGVYAGAVQEERHRAAGRCLAVAAGAWVVACAAGWHG
ncbi:MAG: hypothetical protein MI919_19605, partial [Holophagales bacterium]|nr:hypothetical protein [Holophagales bacterium]